MPYITESFSFEFYEHNWFKTVNRIPKMVKNNPTHLVHCPSLILELENFIAQPLLVSKKTEVMLIELQLNEKIIQKGSKSAIKRAFNKLDS